MGFSIYTVQQTQTIARHIMGWMDIAALYSVIKMMDLSVVEIEGQSHPCCKIMTNAQQQWN